MVIWHQVRECQVAFQLYVHISFGPSKISPAIVRWLILSESWVKLNTGDLILGVLISYFTQLL
jgi:hypothetical protein